MLGSIKGWSFRPAKLSADGSTSLDTLKTEKARLEKRLAEIPGLIAKLQNSINVLSSDTQWLSSLSDRRVRNWEEENGRNVKETIYQNNNILAAWRADIDSLNAEKSRIPGQITEIDKQIGILIQGESTGLSKGIDRATAQQLGVLALEKEKNLIETQAQIQQAQVQQAQAAATQTQTKGISENLKWGLIIGGAALVIGIIAFIVHRNKIAVKMPNTI